MKRLHALTLSTVIIASSTSLFTLDALAGACMFPTGKQEFKCKDMDPKKFKGSEELTEKVCKRNGGSIYHPGKSCKEIQGK